MLFTFHYGPIQMVFRSWKNRACQYLHSTMVLFKSFWFCCITKFIFNLHSTMVLFKWTNIKSSQTFSCIYIPLWSYSNWNNKSKQRPNKSIYIPLWSYSNEETSRVVERCPVFTFHYGPIQIDMMNYLLNYASTFTFHYGPIQIF